MCPIYHLQLIRTCVQQWPCEAIHDQSTRMVDSKSLIYGDPVDLLVLDHSPQQGTSQEG